MFSRSSCLLFGVITKTELEQGILTRGALTLIDVREPSEISAGTIPSSYMIPLGEIESAFSPLTTTDRSDLQFRQFNQRYSFERPEEDDPIVFYCRSGRRSAQACSLAERLGFTNVRNYEGGWLDWSANS